MVQATPYSSSASTTSKRSRADFVPDGNIEKQVWRDAPRARFDHASSGRETYPDSAVEVASLWTPSFIYLAYKCVYRTLNIYEGEDPAQERWKLWERDVVEAFLNPDPARVNHYYEFEVAPNNQWIDLEIDLDKKPFNDPRWNSGFDHATRVDERRHIWTCEMRIPVKSMDVAELRAGAEWRGNFYRADGQGANAERRFLSWSTIPDRPNFHTPTRFGLIRFV